MATWEDLEKSKKLRTENRKEEIKVSNLCFMANIEDEETYVSWPTLKMKKLRYEFLNLNFVMQISFKICSNSIQAQDPNISKLAL